MSGGRLGRVRLRGTGLVSRAGVTAVSAMHRHVQERAGEQEEEWQVTQEVHPVFAEKEIGKRRAEGGDHETAKQPSRVALVRHDL